MKRKRITSSWRRVSSAREDIEGKGRLFLGVRRVLADLLLDHVLAVDSELSLLRPHPIRLLDTEVLEEKLGAVLESEKTRLGVAEAEA